jgi:hypothetical protein
MERLTTLMFCGGIILLIYIAILILIFCDLRAGVRKAKKRNEYRTSDGYKRTIEKISKYFNMTFALTVIDLLQLSLIMFLFHFYQRDIIMIPWFTLIAFGYICFVEIKSIWEPADIKEKKQMNDYRRMLLSLVREYGGVDKLMEALNNSSREQQEPKEEADFNNVEF